MDYNINIHFMFSNERNGFNSTCMLETLLKQKKASHITISLGLVEILITNKLEKKKKRRKLCHHTQ